MNFLSLFAGIGGFDLGLERAGMKCVGQVEIDPWRQSKLLKHWPDVPKWSDIHEFTGDECGAAELVCAGYPCQGESGSGKRKGTQDDRWLWPETFRVLRKQRTVGGRLGLLVRMLLTTKTWASNWSYLIWKAQDTKCNHLVFHLRLVDYLPWNGTFGLLPRPMKMDYKGTSKNRFRGSKTCRRNFRETIREKSTDGTYPNPEFAEWVKGLPIGWTE